MPRTGKSFNKAKLGWFGLEFRDGGIDKPLSIGLQGQLEYMADDGSTEGEPLVGLGIGGNSPAFSLLSPGLQKKIAAIGVDIQNELVQAKLNLAANHELVQDENGVYFELTPTAAAKMRDDIAKRKAEREEAERIKNEPPKPEPGPAAKGVK